MKLLYRTKQLITLSGDLVSFIIGTVIAITVRHLSIPSVDSLMAHVMLFGITFLLWIIVNYINGLYDLGLYSSRSEFYKRFSQTAVFALVVGIIFFYVVPSRAIAPKTILLLSVFFGYGISAIWRLVSSSLIGAKQLQTKVLFIGVTEETKELIDILKKRPEKGYVPTAVIDVHHLLKGYREIDHFDSYRAIRSVIAEHDIKTVVLCEKVKEDEDAMRELYELLFWPVQMHQLGAFYQIVTGRIPPSTFSESWFLEHLRNKEQPIYSRIRRIIDYIAVVPLLAIFVVVLPFVALAIKLSSKGPIFFTQKRVGKYGQVFPLYKFRSMYALAKDGSAEVNGYQFATKNDARVTSVGKFLRKTRLDELPQLFNLLKGDITLIGPRPERPEIVAQLTGRMPYYPLRHVVAPGLTGWAVIHQNYTDTIESSLEKLQYDLFYIKNRSLLLDISILLRTVNLILRGLGQ